MTTEKTFWPLAKALIKHFEGCRLERYIDSAGVPTIGYGHTKSRPIPERIEQWEADRLLEMDMEDAEADLTRSIPAVWPHLESWQKAALLSFVFNLGIRQFNGSTLKKRIVDGPHHDVPSELLRWRMAGGKVLTGLLRRRVFEAHLWIGGRDMAERLEKALEEAP